MALLTPEEITAAVKAAEGWTLDGKAQGAVDGTVTKVGQPQQLDVLEATPTLVR